MPERIRGTKAFVHTLTYRGCMDVHLCSHALYDFGDVFENCCTYLTSMRKQPVMLGPADHYAFYG